MATCSMSTLDEVQEYCCSFCVKEIRADCETCINFVCGHCIQFRNTVYEKHLHHERNKIKQLPVLKKLKRSLLECEEQNDKNIQMFCDYHSQLCCKNCVFVNHSQCSKVTPISELTNTQPTDLHRLSAELGTLLLEIKSLQSSQEASVRSLQGAYNDHEESTIQLMCQNLNSNINAGSNCTLITSDEIEQNIKEKMCQSISSFLDDFENSTLKELKEIKDDVISIKGSITSSINKCTGLQNELTHLYESIKKIRDNKELCLITKIKCEHKIKQALTVLGKSGKVFTVQGKSVHNVRVPSDSETCQITGCCVLPDGHFLITDNSNKKVKLLDQQYQVVNHCGVAARPHGVCPITPSEVAVTVNDLNTHDVQFITITQSNLIPGRKLQLQHTCKGIAHHHGDLFISYGTALYKYSLIGKLVCKLYEDASDEWTVFMCDVSPTGDKLYITSRFHHKLITLCRDGSVLATYKDPYKELGVPTGVHSTQAGQVLVCGHWSHTILQMDAEGRRKLATLATLGRDEVWRPTSVCYSSTTSTIIVGRYEIDTILVFKVK